MSKQSLALWLCALCAAPVLAQTDSRGVTTSTDPAKAAAVERHAEELRAQQAASTIAREPTGAGAQQQQSAKHRHHRHHRHHPTAKAPATGAKH